MPSLPGISQKRAARAFERAGFRIMRQGKHISMSDGTRIIIIPGADPINAFTMGGIIRDSGMTIDQFKKML